MKKIVRLLLIFAGIIIILWIVGSLTGALQFFSVPTISNYPTIKNGDKLFASNLIKPKRLDFICYRVETPEFGKQTWVHRLCGLEGDEIEIRNGILFVNDQNIDKGLSLAHNYIISASELAKAEEIEKIDETFPRSISSDSIIVYLSDKLIQENSLKAVRKILAKTFKDEYIREKYGAEWNQDNFGPVIVPRDQYFVIGDNRQNSQDSRYLGFIDKSKYVATVLARK